jgi:3-oxoacyl-[acyl-carrier protein] reductase
MRDVYQQFANSGLGREVVNRLGLPKPVRLRRYKQGQPLLDGPALVGSSTGGRLSTAVQSVLAAAGVDLTAQDPDTKYAALVYDATGITGPEQLHELYAFFHPVFRRVRGSGRVIVLGTPPEETGSAQERVAQRALEGFTRSAGKEVGRGATAQLVYVSPGAEGSVESTLRFLLSAKSAYVSGQVIRIGAGEASTPESWERPLAGKVALITGASRGIGASIAEVLGRDGAHVVCLDVPSQGAELSAVANSIGGSALQCDITGADAPFTLVDYFGTRHGGVDIVVHNAGITRDKTLAKMDDARWESVLKVNLAASLKVNDALLEHKVLNENGRIVGVASIAGVAGNFGQTNYGTSKAGVIGMVDALAPVLAEQRATINAVAPGFIETQMTAAMPLVTREAGRRMNSLAQGGLPVDVAETIAWFANPASTGVNGNVVRVCGQSLLGA